VNRERLDQWCEAAILGLLLGVLLFAPVATAAVRASDFLIVQGLTLAATALWVARLWLNPRPAIWWPPVCWAVVAFVGYALGRYLTADVEFIARQELIRILVYAFVFFGVLNNVYRKEAAQVVALALVALAALNAAYAVYQWVTFSDRVLFYPKPANYGRRASGTFICPNHLAGFLEMVLPLALAYTLSGRYRLLPRLVIGYAAVMILAGLAVTVSRAGWFAAGVAVGGLLVVKLFHRNYRVPAFATLVLLVIGGAVALDQSLLLKRRLEVFLVQGENLDSAAMRLEVWRGAWQLWQTSPWVGVGPAHYDVRYREFRTAAMQFRPEWVHNDYLNTLVDYGVIGLALVLAAVGLTGYGVFRTWKYVQPRSQDLVASPAARGAPGGNRGAFVLGAALGLVAMAVHSFFDFNLHMPANALVAVTWMALLAGHLRFATDRHWVGLHLRGRLVATALCAAGVVYLGSEGARRAVELRWLRQAAAAPAQSPEQLECWKRAHGVEPRNPQTTYDIGEAYRLQSWSGEDNYRALAETAMNWFQLGMKLNPHDAYNYLRYGMCLHWLGRHEEAAPWFARAEKLDPNGYFMLAHIGWHLVQLEKYAEAKPYFERSQKLTPYQVPNTIPASYLEVIRRRLEAAAPGAPK
jgi:O-antigen ligase